MTLPSASVTTAPTGIVPAPNASHASRNASCQAGSRSSQLCMAESLELSRRREAVEGAAELDLPEHAGHEVLERACVLDAAQGHGLVPRVADQLLGDLACVVVGGVEAARTHALVSDLVVQRGEVRVERLRDRTVRVRLDLVRERLVLLVAPGERILRVDGDLPLEAGHFRQRVRGCAARNGDEDDVGAGGVPSLATERRDG